MGVLLNEIIPCITVPAIPCSCCSVAPLPPLLLAVPCTSLASPQLLLLLLGAALLLRPPALLPGRFPPCFSEVAPSPAVTTAAVSCCSSLASDNLEIRRTLGLHTLPIHVCCASNCNSSTPSSNSTTRWQTLPSPGSSTPGSSRPSSYEGLHFTVICHCCFRVRLYVILIISTTRDIAATQAAAAATAAIRTAIAASRCCSPAPGPAADLRLSRLAPNCSSWSSFEKGVVERSSRGGSSSSSGCSCGSPRFVDLEPGCSNRVKLLLLRLGLLHLVCLLLFKWVLCLLLLLGLLRLLLQVVLDWCWRLRLRHRVSVLPC